MKKTVFFALALAAAGAADAQSATRADPRDPAAQVERPAYRSAFDGYRPFAEQEAADWRKANEEVHAAGGHAGMHRAQSGGAAAGGAPGAKPQPGGATGQRPQRPEPGKAGGHSEHHR